MNILSLDVGTTSMRGVLFDESGKVIASRCITIPLVIKDQKIEQIPSCFSDGITKICKDIRSEFEVDALSITAFRSALCLVDRNGNPLCNFIMWQDTRNKSLCEKFEGEREFVYKKSGTAINTVYTATKLLWLKINEPELYSKAYKAMVVPDFLINFITGEFVTDRTYGSRTHLMNINTLEWDTDLIGLFSIDSRLLCTLIDQGTVAGYVQKSFSETTGISLGTPVVSAGGDQQCGALGLGVMDESSLEINSGTGSFVISLVSSPYLENSSAICNVSAIRGKYILESNILSSASALNWMIGEFFPEYGGSNPDFEAIDRIVEMVPVGANGLYCLPHFQGCGTRDWNPLSKAGFWGFTLSSTRNDIARSIYEGIADEIAKSVEELPAGCRNASRVYVAGGLSKSRIYNQILCEMLDREIYQYYDIQASAIGAFISAAVHFGLYPDYSSAFKAARHTSDGRLYKPNKKNVEIYSKYKDTTGRLYKLLKNI